EASKEFFNRDTKKFPVKNKNSSSLFERTASNKGMLLEVNTDFPILQALNNELSSSGQAQLKVLLRMINTQISDIRQTHEDQVFLGIERNNSLSTEELLETINSLILAGIDIKVIKTEVLPKLGYKMDSFPEDILKVLNDK
ncbi:MAG: ATP-binding protein, partial [Nanoarchaeota archaeon]|nr:ATP-binding protein [Nanoarchaeota archaeon]